MLASRRESRRRLSKQANASECRVEPIDRALALSYAITCASAQEPVTVAVSASETRANLHRLIDQETRLHEPVHISGKRANAVLLSNDWAAIQEILHLLDVLGMRESIKASTIKSVEFCSTQLAW